MGRKYGRYLIGRVDRPKLMGGERIPIDQRRADAIGLVAESALASGLDKGTRGDRYQVVVHVEAGVLADPDEPGVSEIEDGPSVPAETSRRIACDAGKVVMIHDAEGRILDVGRRKRTVSTASRRALTHRDRRCRFPGCRSNHCDAHHLEHWADGGETKLDNLALLCRRHHRAVHEGGFRVERLPDGEFRSFQPNGTEIPAVPRLVAVGDDPRGTLVARLSADGVSVDRWTGYPGWDGGSIEWHQAIDSVWEPRRAE